jgi:hypothetical protein
MPAWAFVSLIVTALLTLWIAYGYLYLWQDYDLPVVRATCTNFCLSAANILYVKLSSVSYFLDLSDPVFVEFSHMWILLGQSI